jgi:hypothetical protein
VVAENLIYFEDLALSLGKDKKSFFHGVHNVKEIGSFLSLFLLMFKVRKDLSPKGRPP